MKTSKEYLASLKDNRVIFMNGKRIADVTEDPVLGVWG